MEAKLVVISPEEHAGEHILNLPTLIGRGRDATLKLLHPLVSRKHCEVRQEGGQLIVRDLGSLNGTFIRGTRIEADTPLAPGDLLVVGNVTFRAEYEQASSKGSATGTSGAVGAVGGAAASELDETLFLPESSGAGEISEADAEIDWDEMGSLDSDETRSVPTISAANDAAEPEFTIDESAPLAEADLDLDEIPEIQFNEPGAESPSRTSSSATDEFDPMEFLGGDVVSADETKSEPAASERSKPATAEASVDADALPDLDDDLALAPLDDLELASADKQEPWDFSDDGGVENSAASNSNAAGKSDDDDLDEFLKGLK